MVRLLVPLVVLVAVLAAIYPAARLPEPDPVIGDFLPAGDPVSVLVDGGDGRPWQANQGLREPLAGVAELSAPLRRAIGTPTEADGSWLMVDAIRPDQDTRVLRLAYQVTDRIVLRGYQDSAGWAVFTPGLPMLTSELINGGTLSWSGTVVIKSVAQADGKDPIPVPASATVKATEGDAGCTTVGAELLGDATLPIGATWCTGAAPGWAGAVGPAFSLRVAANPPDHRPELSTDPPAPPRLDAATTARVRLLGRLAGRWQEQPISTASRLASAGSTLIVADLDGTVSGWTPVKSDDPAESYYGRLWQVRPGGSVRGLTTVGDITAIGTTARTVSAFAGDGWRLWQHALDDAVVDLATVGDGILATDASGGLHLLDARTGSVRWTVDGGDLPWPPVVGPAGRTIAYLDGDTVHVLDAATGRDNWTADVAQESAEVAVAGDQVVIKAGSWLIARDAADGRTLWTSEVAAGALLAGGPDEVLVFGDESHPGPRPDRAGALDRRRGLVGPPGRVRGRTDDAGPDRGPPAGRVRHPLGLSARLRRTRSDPGGHPVRADRRAGRRRRQRLVGIPMSAPYDDRLAGGPPPAAYRRPSVFAVAWQVITELFRRVLVDPVRSGRLRGRGWPNGLRPAIGIGLGLYVLAVVLALVAVPVRRALPPGDSAFGISPQLFPIMIMLTLVLLSLICAASLHAPWYLRLVGLLAPTVFTLGFARFADRPDQLLWPAVALLALIGFSGWRWTRRYAWWEFPALLLLTGAGTLGLLWAVIRPALNRGSLDVSFETVVALMAVGVFALPFTVVSGAALAEVALSSASWLVELISRRISLRALGVLVGLLVPVSVLIIAVRWWTTIVPPLPKLIGLSLGGAVVGLTWFGWLVVDSLMDRRERSAGLLAGDTRLAQLPAPFRTLSLGLGVALVAPFMINWCWSRAEWGLWPVLHAAGLDYRPGALTERLGWSGDPLTAGFALTLVVGLVITAVAVRRRRRGLAELAIVASVLCLIRLLTMLEVPFVAVSLDDLATVVIMVTVVATLGWAVRRRLTPVRLEAVALALVLGLAVALRELVADPLGWLLGSTGGALMIIGLVWGLLTGGAEANRDSPRFPRPARALALIGYFAIAMVITAFDQLAVTFAVDLDRFTLVGSDLLGTGLLLTGLWAVIGAARRREEILEPTPPPPVL